MYYTMILVQEINYKLNVSKSLRDVSRTYFRKGKTSGNEQRRYDVYRRRLCLRL